MSSSERLVYRVIASGVLLCSVFNPAPAQEKSDEFRSIRAARVNRPPAIDGELEDSCWQTADWQGDFTQLKPLPGKPALARTQVAVAFDDRRIYAAFRCFNPTGESANSQITRRDENMDQDNAVTLYLDTFHTRRDCYYFSTNSLGTQVDGRIGEDGRTNDKSWDCGWQVATHEDSSGWTAEFSIPVSEIRIPKGTGLTWGINFRRNYPDLFETSFWRERDTAWRVSQSGELLGLEEFKKSFSASLYPYLIALDSNTPVSNRRKIYSSGGTGIVAGADLRLNVGSTANANITYNPDFATVEADWDEFNLTRFELFFPEKRLYFLEGGELFNNRINVFYSRRIGDIDYGIKGNGRVDKFNYALLSARERPTGDEPATFTSVLRLQRDIFASSNIGLLAVDRSFSGGFNRALSTDATLNFPANFIFTSQFVGSFPSGGENFTKAYFVRLARENEIYHYHMRFTNIDPGFKDNVNQIGFIQDDDRHELDSDVTYAWWIKRYNIERLNFDSRNNAYWSHQGALRSVRLNQWIGVTFKNKFDIGFTNTYQTELFEKRFHNHTRRFEMGYNRQQWNFVGFNYLRGRNFDSDITSYGGGVRFKLRDKLTTYCEFGRFRLSPDPEKRSTLLYVLSADYNFTPDLWLRLFSQFRTSNDRVYVYGFFGWRFVPPFGALYLVYTADRFDQFDYQFNPMTARKERTFFLKFTLPLAF